ncbi:GNAT family N-acetyltransferase [Corynebacterium guangdongense]|uniref:Acetyltransferase n=1 Tax=Corynebacterium guangdongense TaxID=1783348 RepID=A0ABU2A096_9CORY|nr:GNAT family N-acetyltransferase [Corynebacterium guangdongense]MDR7330601.1 putative acetyltransferase [Corynebacterium guangdongense]WJZ16618.1 hypothetical protein CGUA_00030 [Corynebacterium guangdongense]
MTAPRLIVPDASLHASWVESFAEWPDPQDHHGDGLLLAGDLDLRVRADFSEWVRRLIEDEVRPRPGLVTATNRWLVDASGYLGSGQLRHHLGTDYLRDRGGHIGYSVRPSARGNGYAHVILQGMLHEGRIRGLGRVMVSCLADNAASAATIRRAGGVLCDEDDQPGLLRFWISLN